MFFFLTGIYANMGATVCDSLQLPQHTNIFMNNQNVYGSGQSYAIPQSVPMTMQSGTQPGSIQASDFNYQQNFSLSTMTNMISSGPIVNGGAPLSDLTTFSAGGSNNLYSQNLSASATSNYQDFGHNTSSTGQSAQNYSDIVNVYVVKDSSVIDIVIDMPSPSAEIIKSYPHQPLHWSTLPNSTVRTREAAIEQLKQLILENFKASAEYLSLNLYASMEHLQPTSFSGTETSLSGHGTR